MGTIFNVPVTWKRDASAASYREAYIGTISLNYNAGNVITGTWGALSGSGVTKTYDITQYWNYLEIKSKLTQGEAAKDFSYKVSGKYYPGGRSYSYTVTYSEPLVQATSYTVSLIDSQAMFDTGQMTVPATFPLDVSSVTVDKPKNFSSVGTEIFNNITVKWEMASSNKIDYQIIQDGKTLINKTNQTGKQLVIPYGTLQTTNSATVKVRSHFNFLGTEYYSDWVTYTLSGLKALTAETPSNLRIVGPERAIEENLSFAWDTTEVLCKATVEIWQDGTMFTTQSNIANKQYILSAGTLKKPSQIRVRVKNTLTKNGYTHTSSYTELNVNDLISIRPIINDFVLSAFNADYPIIATITAANAQNYEIYKGTTKIVSGASNTLTIPAGALAKGFNALKAVVTRTSSAGTLKEEIVKSFSIVHDEPLIYSVEPSKINVNIDELSRVSFSTNQFIDRWELFINGSLFTSGTTEREVQIGGGIFRPGANTLKVTAYYSPLHDSSQVRAVSKEATFTGFGKPTAPILDSNTVYDTATPTFTWTTGEAENDEQAAFEIEVYTESKTVNSTNKSYTMTTSLLDNQIYTVRVRIKNKYEMWSDWAEKDFQTIFSKLPRPTIILSPQKENVLIIIECVEIATFNNMSIYRSTDKENWIEIANDLNLNDNLTDYMVAGGVETFYKARVYDTAGGYNESEVKGVKAKLMNYNLLNVQDLKNNKQLDFVSINFNNNFTSVIKLFAGAIKPVFYKGKGNYLTADMTVKLVNEEVNNFVEYLSKGEIFCYRDYKGKKLFVSIDVTAVNYINPFMQEIVLNLTEVNFNERLYANKHQNESLKIVYLDGSYYLDGTIDLSGLGVDL